MQRQQQHGNTKINPRNVADLRVPAGYLQVSRVLNASVCQLLHKLEDVSGSPILQARLRIYWILANLPP